ncbi:hypothetical protein I3843_08G008400 [Carya illinoinensis]|uniref:Uncharacterized protein n=1 Tax=Carya illinoinensis TaxID=32201 RepID=A0A8T1PQI6_CARIL|nr:uncharacterized protein LOC122274152 [Carya illinoinensis]KAG6643751.1 hypothetical protein CIPAW_08G008100 [Carya illinoinensis]KAG6698182.1 hypothetical protein I3842_08G008000 [Carya illinoinensis]KAG7965583.1 hypothetical protein I3843_08G008400 [Carya illinoinensis]
MARDEWVSVAMTDDTVVAELLVRLKQSQAASSSLKSWTRAVVPLRWGLRQPRSRSVSLRCDAVPPIKEADSTRGSPTTPLSWSGGASPSATADSFEESSFHASFSFAAFRSKGVATSESTATKRSRRKKTFVELKEEESSLLKERITLKKELATLRSTFKEQRARNESLKRIKLDSILHSTTNLNATCDGLEKAVFKETYRGVASVPDHNSLSVPENTASDDNLQSEPCEADKAAAPASDGDFLLPDLNMMPSEEDSSTETLYGMS